MLHHPSPKRHALAAALGIAVAGLAFSALAARGTEDRTVATAILAQQAASSASPASSHALDQTRRALERADQARSTGDETNARHIEGLAREWAEMARDAALAANAEGRADQSQRTAAGAAASVRKSQAMLETLAGRRSRAEGELQQLRGASSASIPAAALSAARLRSPATASASAPKGSR
jgi:hypothetical protein